MIVTAVLHIGCLCLAFAGIEYTVGRIPIASCDFSTHQYSYADTAEDFNLDHFSLAEEDLLYKVDICTKIFLFPVLRAYPSVHTPRFETFQNTSL